MDKVVGVVETRNNLRELLDEVGRGKRVIIAQRSRARAVLMNPEDIETLEVMADRELLRELVEAKSDIRAGRYKTFDAYFKKSSHGRRTKAD